MKLLFRYNTKVSLSKLNVDFSPFDLNLFGKKIQNR
jgi:hypothetical protein